MRAILDTNLLIDGELSYPQYKVAVSSLSWAELGYGIRKAVDPLQRAHREARLASLQRVLGPGIAFDDSAASAFQHACGLVLATGREIRGRIVDLMIAATAAAHGAAVLTRDAKDFAGLEEFITVKPV